MASSSHGTTIEKLQSIHKNLEAQRTGGVPWVKTTRADSIFGAVIMLNAVFIGVELEFNNSGMFNWGFWATETAFLVIFIVELILRFQAAKPKRSFFDAWGIFDTIVTLAGCVDAWVITFFVSGQDNQENPLSSFVLLRVLRLVRLVRLLRVLRMFSELVILVNTIVNSMKAVTWMSILLGLIVYIGSILTVMLVGLPFRELDEEVDLHFGSLGSAIFSHFCIVTLEGWVDVAAAAMKHSKFWAIYFVGIIILTNFCLVNLMIGVIVERIITVAQEQEQEIASFVSESEQFKLTLKTLFDCADMDGSGEVTREEVRELLEDNRTHDIMSAFGINVKMPRAVLHTIMDLHTDGPTTFDEFFENCIRLSGSKANVHSVFVQHDICACHQELKRNLVDFEHRLDQVSRSVQSAPGVTPPMVVTAPAKPVHVAPPSPSKQEVAPGPAPPESPPQQGSAENYHEVRATMRQLMDRMDQFSFVQQHIMAELYALKEHARMTGRGEGGSSKSGGSAPSQAGRNVDGCCAVDSIYDRPTAMSLAVFGGRLGSFCSIGQEQKANNSQIIAPPSGLTSPAGGERKASPRPPPDPGSAPKPTGLTVSADEVRRGFEAEFQARRGGRTE